MLVATVEDLQGSVEVVVFPKVFAETANAWTDDSVVLVTGRIDHRDDSAQILCEAVHAWDDAVRMGPAAFGVERDRLLRGRGRPPGGWGSGNGSGGNGNGGGGNGNGRAVSVTPDAVVAVRPRGAGGTVAVPVIGEPDDEPTAPRDAVPLQASPTEAGTIAIGFDAGVAPDRILPAIESMAEAIRGTPGEMPVVISIPVAGATRQVRLPERAAWDERLGDRLRQAAGVPVAVELRPTGTGA
jgi:hypothetical protein